MNKIIIKHVWLIQPILFVAFVLLYCVNPIQFEYFKYNVQITDLVPIIPSNHQTIWRLGQLSNTNTSESLKEASELVNFNFTNFEQFLEFCKSFDQKSTSIITRVWNLITFVNILILIGGFGMVVTFFPVIHLIVGPLSGLLIKLIKLTMELLIKMKPILEFLGYVVCFMFIVYGAHMPKLYGINYALVGWFAHACMLAYSICAHCEDKNIHYISWIMCVTAVPLALFYQSQIFGFLAVSTFYSAIGFSSLNLGMCYIIGFNNKFILHRCITTSLMLVPTFLSVRNVHLLDPFFTAIYVYGLIVFYVGMLIISSKSYYNRNSTENAYGQAQIMMIISLTWALFFGSVMNIQSILNVGMTFTFLYIWDKFIEFSIWSSGNIIILLFASSVILYNTGLFLHRNPKFLVSLIMPFE